MCVIIRIVTWPFKIIKAVYMCYHEKCPNETILMIIHGMPFEDGSQVGVQINQHKRANHVRTIKVSL